VWKQGNPEAVTIHFTGYANHPSENGSVMESTAAMCQGKVG